MLLDGLHQGQLRCLVRDVAKAEAVGLPSACLVVGDLRDPGCDSDLRRAAEGVEVVVHLAGSTKAYDRRGFHDVNVQGTRRLLDAVVATAPDAHFVHVSSLAAAGPSLDGSTSTVLADQARTVSNYGESSEMVMQPFEKQTVRSGAEYGTMVRISGKWEEGKDADFYPLQNKPDLMNAYCRIQRQILLMP